MSNSKKKNIPGGSGKITSSKEKSPPSRLKWLAIIPLLILTYLVYTPALKNSITGWDDSNYITENNDIRELNSAFIKKVFLRIQDM
ncbi:MAG: hypothetical protein IPJ66_10030 [Bacteroidetes bacterium]|nr:hypothetical protein [Bacteroidota bacterium]